MDPEEVVSEEQIVPEAEPVETPEAALPLSPDDRPAKNVLAELSRKYTKIERQQQQDKQEILAAIQGMQAQRPPPQPVAPAPAVEGAQYSDEQLGQLAAAGNPEALRILVERQTKRQTEAQFGQFRQQQTVTTALNELFGRYPMLRSDTSHPLTQAVYAARQQFLNAGWTPGPQTDLEAIKAAIVNAPHLAPSQEAPMQDTTRRAGVTAQQSMEGAAPRRSPQTAQTAVVKPLSDRVQGIAQRMNVKDPAGSIKRFEARQEKQRSTVSPIIQQAIREEQA